MHTGNQAAITESEKGNLLQEKVAFLPRKLYDRSTE